MNTRALKHVFCLRNILRMSTRAEINRTSNTVDVYNDTPSQQKDKPLHFPFVWLRDNCQCTSCFHPVSKARLFLMRDLNPDIVPKTVEVNKEEDSVVVTWPDDHQSIFSFNWLKDRGFTKDAMEKRQQAYLRDPIMWNNESLNKIPTTDYNELISSDKALYRWLTGLEDTGIHIITDAPRETGVLKEIAKRVAFLRKTHYGETFTVKAKIQPSNVAYTSATLGLHTDLIQCHYTPGMQMLHCITQVPTEGGDNIFTDGFYVANLMKKEYPDMYKLLTTVKVDYYDIGTDAYKFHKMTRVPIIQLTREGNMEKINYNNQVRDTVLNTPLDTVQPLYKAIVKYEELLNDNKYSIHYKLKDGEIACFHNYRVLHGRQGYTALQDGERHLEGAYLDWDELRSKRRVLEEELGIYHLCH